MGFLVKEIEAYFFAYSNNKSNISFYKAKDNWNYTPSFNLKNVIINVLLVDAINNSHEYIFLRSGETSCGKSSLINLILGEKILPTGIASCMPMVCRVKYSERYEISTKDCNGKEQENMSFGNIEGMTEKIESLAIRDSVEIIYVDIYLPVPFLQVYAFTKKKPMTFQLI